MDQTASVDAGVSMVAAVTSERGHAAVPRASSELTAAHVCLLH